MKKFGSFALALAAFAAACSDGPSGLPEDAAAVGDVVVTTGVPTPAPNPGRPARSTMPAPAVTSTLGGSSTTPLALLSCGPSREVVVDFPVNGKQGTTATFDVLTVWTYNGTSFVGSVPTTITQGPRSPGSPTPHLVTITVVNGSGASTGTASFEVPAFNLTNSSGSDPLVFNGNEEATVYVEFDACESENTPPTLVLPELDAVEATSSAGAAVFFTVTASDLEDGDLSAFVVCDPASGSTFALGTTTVDCSVTDLGGLSAEGSFDVTVEDTTPAYFTSFPGDQVLIAQNIDGAILDLGSLGIAVADVGGVSEPSTYACDYDGSSIAIGQSTTVACTASDALGNESGESYFDVSVTLDLSGVGGFLPPLRMSSPFSAHKRGSTIPHKFHAPAYADGSPATDLAGGLRLVISSQGGGGGDEVIEANDYSAGSTEWRYDPTDGQYVFNLKSEKTWRIGLWLTEVSYAGITLAETTFSLSK